MSQDDTDTRRFHRLRSAASTTRRLAGAWADAKTARLQAAVETPQSWVDGGGDASEDRWQDRRAKRKQLKEYHKVRRDGGIVATLLEARALMVFGPGGKFTSEDDEVADWLNDQLNDRDNLTYDIGLDTYFFGYALGEPIETTGGDFSHIELIEPWTTVPQRNRKGEIDQWEQEITEHGGKHTQTFDPDDIVHFKTMKASGRDRVGMSLLGRSMDEAEAYRDNQRAIKNAVQMQGFPKFHVKLGREGGAVIDDNELRRARPQFDNIHELTKWVTGQDVDIDVIEAESFEFEGITEHDLSKLAIAFMLPVELTQIGGGDGLGTGFPAKLRRQLFLLGARSHQRLLGDQLVQQVGRPLLEEYSPFDADTQIEYTFNDPITDVEELQTVTRAIGDDLTSNERRELFDFPPHDDDDIGESYDAPGESGGEDGNGLDFFSEHALADTDEDVWMQLYEEKLWTDETDQRLLAFSDAEVPQFVQERLREAILGGALFPDFDGVDDLMDLRMEFVETLTEDGWSIAELQDRILEIEPDLAEHEAERIARTETQAVVNDAREIGYRERDDFEDLRFRWAGPDDHRTTETCEAIKDQTPEEGLSLSELESLVEEVAREEGHDPRKWTPHIQCRHTYVRDV
ncbi:hypothetical protein [Halorarum salinum]|uniref:Phage portal protein n=1 Tax=Halorarum salinum TaxID=2743089 RepID=A0A7D5QHK7_9EURY|nr:hypothetical protein [Halobaculum salinum]QLG62822.1 hypothetical protein HUG12_14235 [Halobaculum salinum]